MAAETVDTRVVEAKFDSKQFEQGVDRTVKKLDELKKSLNLKDGEKSVAEIGNKISETSEKASNSLEKLEQRFTSFFGMLKQKLISGIADEIVGSIFKVKNAINGLVSSLSTGQIGYGMQRYTDILTSVRTLTASGVVESAAYETIERLGSYADQTSYSLDQLVSTMSKFKTAGADLHTAQRMVEGLSNAAASMGVNAQDAARAYLNLQQAYSKGKMTQADWISFESLPMVGERFNQAILEAAEKVGTLKKSKSGNGYDIDSKVIKALGGTGVRTGGAAAKGITAENMGSKLASGWFNKQVMEEVFGNTYYFAEVDVDEVNKYKAQQRKIRDQLRAEGVKEEDLDSKARDELQKYFDTINEERLSAKKAEIEERKVAAKAELEANKSNKDSYKKAKEAYDKTIKELDKEYKDFELDNKLSATAFEFFEAGQEARSFTDVLNTLKDTISRGWAKSFELIFGQLDEAKDFFTSLTESQLAEGIYAIGEFRNAVLENWRNTGGRESLLGLLEYMDNIAGSIWKKLGLINDEEKWFNDNFDQQKYNQILKQEGKEQAEAYKEQVRAQASAANPFEQTAKELGQRLSILTRNIQDFFEKVHKWFTEADSTGTSRLQRISNILEGFGTIGRGALYAVGQGLEFVGKVYNTFKTSFDALWKAIDNISQKVFAVFNPDIKTDGFNIFTALTDTFENILTVLKPLNEPLTKLIGILEDVAGFFVDMGISSILMNIQFFTDGFALLLEVLGLGSSQQARGAGVLDGIVRDIKDLGESCKSAMTAVGDFFKSLFDDLRILLGLKEDANGQKNGIFANIENWFNTNEFVQKVKAKIDKAFVDIGDFVKDLPNRITNIGINIGDFFKGIFYEKTLVTEWGPTGQTSRYEWVKRPLTEWVENVVNTVWNFITVEIPNFVKGIPNIVSEFLNGLFYTKNIAQISYANGKRTVTYVRTPLKKWIDNAIVEVKKFIKDIPNQLNKIPSLIEEFFKSIFYYKTSVANGGVTWVKKPFTQWIDENIVKNLKTFITELPTYIGQAIGTVSNFAGQVVSAIFGKEDGSPVTADDVTEGIRKPFLGVNVTGIINSIKGVAKRILSGIASAFTGETDWESNKNWLAEGAGKLLENIKTKAEEIWDSVQDFFATLPEKIEGFFKGSAKETEEGGTIWTAGQSVIDGIGKWLSTVPNLLLNAWKSAEALSGGLWNTIIGWITGKGDDKQLNAFNQNIYDQMRNSKSFDTAEMFKESALKQQWRENNPVAANISDFFVHLGDYFKEKILAIPGQIKGIASNALEVLTAIKHVIFGEVDPEKYNNPDHPIYTAVTNVFNGVVKWVTDNAGALKDEIVRGWNKAVTFANIISEVFFGGGKQAFSQKEYDSILNSKGLNVATRNIEAEIYKNSTTDYGSETRNRIADFFVGVRDWIREKIIDLPNAITRGWEAFKNFGKEFGPVILKGLNSAIEWLNTGFKNLTTWIQDLSTGKNGEKLSFAQILEKQFTDPDTGEVSPIWEGIRALGASIRDFLIKTIPDFVKEAVSWLSKEIPKIIGGLFGGGKNDSESSLFNASIAGSVQGLSVDISTVLGSNGKSLEDIFKDGVLPYRKALPIIKKEVSDVQEETTKLLNSLAEGNPYELFTKEMSGSKSSGSFFENLLGLLIPSAGAEGIETNTLGALGLFSGASSVLLASPLSSGGGSEHGFEEEKSLKNKALEGVVGIIESFGTIVEKISKNKLTQWIGIGVILIMLLNQISKIVDQVSMIDEIGDTAKWIGIGSLLTAVAGILGYMTILSAQAVPGSEEEKKLKRIKDTLNDFKQILVDIMEPLKWIIGLFAAKELFSMLKELFSEDDAETKEKVNLTKGEKFGKLLLSPLASLWEGLVGGLSEGVGAASKTAGVYVSGTMIGQLIEDLSGNANDALGQLGSGIGVLTDNIGKAVEDLKGRKQDLQDAIESVGLIKDLIIEMLGLLTQEVEIPVDIVKVNQSTQTAYDWTYGVRDIITNEEDATTETERIMQKTKVSVIPKLGEITKVFTELSGSLSLFKNAVSGYGDDSTKVSEAFAKIIGSSDGMKSFVEFVNSNDGKDWAVFKDALTSIGAIMHLYSNSLSDAFAEKPKDINIDNAAEFISQLFGNDKIRGLIDSFSEKELPNIDEKNLKNAESIIIFAASLTSIAKACAELPENAASDIQAFITAVSSIEIEKDETEDSISSLSQKLGTLGNALSSFALNTSGLTTENLQNAERALSMMLRIATGLGSIPDNSWFAKITRGDKGIDTFSQQIHEVGNNMAQFFKAIENTDASGLSKTYNKKNLEMVLEAVETFARIAIASNGIRLDGFNALVTALTKDKLEPFAESINAFIAKFFLPGEDKRYEFSEDDFSYLNNVFKIMNDISAIMLRINNMKFDNLGELSNITETNNPLVQYASKIIDGMFQVGHMADKYSTGLSYMEKYKKELTTYMDLITSIFQVVALGKRSVTTIEQSSMSLLNTIVESLFGWTTHSNLGDHVEDVYHEGVFQKIFEFFETADKYETLFTGHSKAFDVFNGISDMIIGFTEAITQMAKADEVSMMFSQFHADYSSYVTQLASVLEAIMENEDVFIRFFEFGGKFNTGYVSNIALMTQALNNIVQMVATMKETASFLDTATLLQIQNTEWSRLFEIFQDNIIGNNMDFFSPKITPVLELGEFEESAKKMWSMLGINPGEDWASFTPNMTVNMDGIQFPQPIDYTLHLQHIESQVDDLKQETHELGDQMSKIQFVIKSGALTETIGPDMDKWLGQEAAYVVRANVNNGG